MQVKSTIFDCILNEIENLAILCVYKNISAIRTIRKQITM